MKRSTAVVAVMAGLGLASWAGVAAAGEGGHKKDPARDAQLEQQVDSRLQDDLRLARQSVDAAVKNGVVTLNGTVETEADKVRAEQIARTTAGKAKIKNQLAVVESSENGSDPLRKAPPDEQEDRRALSDPRRRDPLVGTMPADQTGSKEIRLRTTGLPDPVLEKREAEKKQQQQQAQPKPQEANPRDGSRP
jgi:hypothetical protein